MPTVRSFFTPISTLALFCAVGAGCAARPQVTATAAPPAVVHTEVVELEKTIADNKARMRSAGPAADAPESASVSMSAGAPAPSPRCDGVCRAGQEICTASRRICKIASAQPDPVVITSCQRAERDCTDASALCAQCH